MVVRIQLTRRRRRVVSEQLETVAPTQFDEVALLEGTEHVLDAIDETIGA
jgi:hypothetical protein